MLSTTERRLQRITKLTTAEVKFLKEGVAHAAAFGQPLDDILAQTIADRLNLADSFIDMGTRMVRSRADLARPAIARLYYAMYHAMRAASFQYYGGDDHEAHSTLSMKGVPQDYPTKTLSSNELKNARALRNEADYDQYPVSTTYFRSEARSLMPIAAAFVTTARSYVQSKGNRFA